ncbi:MAG: FG-GAP-like repeat-containing protein [Myxococcaceae bacterium]
MTLLLTSAPVWAAPLSGFPKKLGAPVEGSAVVLELNGPGPVCAVVGAGNRVQAFCEDGKAPKGFPFDVPNKEKVVGDLAAADLSGDKHASIAFVTSGGKLFLVRDGVVVPGFPRLLEEGAVAGPSFADLDGDGKPELLQGDRSGKLHAFKSGMELANYPLQLGAPLTSPVSVGHLAGTAAIAVGAENGTVFVIDPSGKALPGFPFKANGAVTGSPAFGDVDGDGNVDVIASSKDFNVYAANESGALLKGFPFGTGMGIYGGPALADIDDDGALDIIVTSSDGSLYVANGHGKALPGFPVALGPTIVSGTSVGDLDRDGSPDLITATTDGKLHALSRTGKPLAGFPMNIGSRASGTPFISAFKKEEQVVFIGTPEGDFTALKSEKKGKAVAAKALWSGSGRDAAHGGWYFPNPARYTSLVIQPPAAFVDDSLQAQWQFVSVDRTSEPTPDIQWWKDGKVKTELAGLKQLPARTAKKGEKWAFELRAGSRAFRSPERVISDTAPTSPVVRAVPAAPTREGNLKVELVKPGVDADGSNVAHRFLWLVDGKSSGITQAEVPAATIKKGQRWTAVVTALDGTLESPIAQANALVGNAPPTAPEIALEPKTPRRETLIKAVITKAATDLDADTLRYRYKWKVNGEVRNHPLTQDSLPAGLLHKGDKVEVEVFAFDGEARGPGARAQTEVQNTAPLAPKVALSPNPLRAGQPLRAVVSEAATDVDGDPIRYAFVWTRDGKPSPGASGDLVSATDVKKGGKWQVKVTPSDGVAEGPSATAELVVQDTAPTAPSIALDPVSPRAGAPVKLVIAQPSQDVDGDAIKYSYAWTRNGKVAKATGDALTEAEVVKHERIRITLTPTDGTLEGIAGTAEVEVENAPPTAPQIAIEPAEPTLLTGMKAVVRTASTDADKDSLTYRYTWLKDGVPQPLPESQAELAGKWVRKGERWTVVVRANDGEVVGPPARALAQIGNAAPPVPSVTLVPKVPKRGSGLRAVVTDVVDPDGDPVTYRYEWKRNGKPALSLEASGIRGDDLDSLRSGDVWTVEVVATDGMAKSPVARAEVKIANTAPTSPQVSLCNGPVSAGAAINAQIVAPATDLDGDAISYEYVWTVNGKPMPNWKGRTALGAGDTRKHDLVRVAVTPKDSVEAGVTTAAECDVEDSAPSAPKIAFSSESITAQSVATVKVTQASTDPDGDKLVYRYSWLRNGLPVTAKEDTLPAGTFHHGDAISVAVRAFDGEREGPASTVSLRASNSVPPVPKVSLSPADPRIGVSLKCNVESPATDSDAEPLRVHYAWLRNGAAANVGLELNTLPAGVVRKGESWRCEAWTDDGVALSARAAVDVTVKNTRATAPSVVLEPDAPGTNEDLFCRVSKDSGDADGDRVQYSYQWTRNGKQVAAGEDPTRISSERTSRGDVWRCEVRAHAGEESSVAAYVEDRIRNTAPGMVAVRLNPQQPVAGEVLSCEIVEPAKDPDADAVSYRITWYKDGVAQSFSFASAQVPGRLVKASEMWSCSALAVDGELEGAPTSSETVAVQLKPIDDESQMSLKK